MEWLVLVSGVVAGLYVANGLRPRRGRWTVIPGFFAAWLTIELSLHWLALVVAVGVGGVAAGAAASLVGLTGLVLLAGSAIGLVVLAREGQRSHAALGRALVDLPRLDVQVDTDSAEHAGRNRHRVEPSRFPRSHVALPFLVQHRRGVRRVRNVVFARVAGQELRLDLTLPSTARPGDLRPVVLQIHGGGWMMGYKRSQGQPLLNHLAAQGWVGVNIDYRLSPAATFPDHLVDCKRAVAWIREHITDFGGDPEFVCVTGGSAGGHLAALVGLTANRADYQPGFEAVDTSVRAVVPAYGIYDLTNRLGTWSADAYRHLLEPWVIKAYLDEEPERFAAASPVDHVHADAPPFLVLHGDRDVLTPVDDARLFVQSLGAVSTQPVFYAELVGAQHAFDLFPSLRAAATVEAVSRFFTTIWREYQGAAVVVTAVEAEPLDPVEPGDMLTPGELDLPA